MNITACGLQRTSNCVIIIGLLLYTLTILSSDDPTIALFVLFTGIAMSPFAYVKRCYEKDGKVTLTCGAVFGMRIVALIMLWFTTQKGIHGPIILAPFLLFGASFVVHHIF